MSAYYDLYETPSPDGKEDKKSLHARICPKRTYTQKEFVEHIATFQHLPKNVIGAALDACIDELCDLLANGNIVELGELGFFSTSLKCLRETDDEKKKIRSESVQFQNVHLRISSTFRNNIKKKMTLERVHSTTKKSKKVVETTEETPVQLFGHVRRIKLLKTSTKSSITTFLTTLPIRFAGRTTRLKARTNTSS